MSESVESYPFLSDPKQNGDLGSLAHYRVIRELGRGGMGFVFEAEDAKLKRPVALKVMNQKISATPGSRKRFISEARSMAAVHHDNVATIFEVGESGGTPFMAMEMLKGETLEEFNRRNKKEKVFLGFDEVIRYATEIARGLAAAHTRGIVHRDIKPANIWIESGTNRIKILDFGLALASTPVDQMAGRGAVIGTPGYLSPEQARSDPLDDRSDLYSLGVVLYELCTGVLPIISKSVPEQLISILAHRPKPINEINPEIPKPLCDAIHKLIRKEPRARFQSADAFETSLDDVREACEQTTEVALAINKLKEGLNEVVVKKPDAFDPNLSGSSAVQVGSNGDPSFASLDEINVPVIDPLASSAMAIDPLGTPLGGPVASGSSSGAMRSVAMGNRPKSGSGNKTPLQKYGPLIAVVAVVLITLPVIAFAVTGFGRDAPVPVAQSTGNQSTGNQSTGNQSTGNQPSTDNSPANPSPDVKTNPGNNNAANATGGNKNNQSNSQNGNKNGKKNWNGKNKKNQNNGGKKNQSNGANKNPGNASMDSNSLNSPSPGNGSSQNNNAGMSPSGSASTNPTTPDSSSVSMTTGSKKPDANMTGKDDSNTKMKTDSSDAPSSDQDKEQPEELPRKSLWITTADGRGADAMVKAGSTENFGENPAIGVRRRGEIEVNHSYLRFDLDSISDRIFTVKDATLVMNVVGGKTPVDADLQVYGIENVGVWPENALEWRNSPSNKAAENGLLRLQPLADVILGENSADGQRPGVVRIASEQIDDFIRNSEDTVTFAITGSLKNKLVQFVSRDRTNGAPPRLKLSVSKDPPSDEEAKKFRDRKKRKK